MKLLVSLSTLVSAQDHGTQATARAMVQLLNYCDVHPDAFIRYKKSYIILAIHSDSSYLSKSKLRSR